MNVKIPRTDYFKVPFAELILDEDNAREDLGDIESLAISIYSTGIQNPVKGYRNNGKFYITDGKRRYYACKYILDNIAASHEILVPFVPEERGTNSVDRIFNRIVLNGGKPYTPLEMSVEIAKLKLANVQNKVIAEKIGFTEVYVSNLVKLSKAPLEVKSLIEDKTITATAVMQFQGDWNELLEQVQTIQKESEKRSDIKIKSTSTKITNTKTNSFSLLKQYLKEVVDLKSIPETKLLFFDFLQKCKDNEILLSDVEYFFEVKIDKGN